MGFFSIIWTFLQEENQFIRDVIIIFAVFWLKYNDLRHINIWQTEHDIRSRKMQDVQTTQGKAISEIVGELKRIK